MYTFPEADWRILKRVHPLALERYCEQPRRSIALTMLAGMHAAGVLKEDEFLGFSPLTRSEIEFPLRVR
jgi:hypothetical protein